MMGWNLFGDFISIRIHITEFFYPDILNVYKYENMRKTWAYSFPWKFDSNWQQGGMAGESIAELGHTLYFIR